MGTPCEQTDTQDWKHYLPSKVIKEKTKMQKQFYNSEWNWNQLVNFSSRRSVWQVFFMDLLIDCLFISILTSRCASKRVIVVNFLRTCFFLFNFHHSNDYYRPSLIWNSWHWRISCPVHVFRFMRASFGTLCIWTQFMNFTNGTKMKRTTSHGFCIYFYKRNVTSILLI